MGAGHGQPMKTTPDPKFMTSAELADLLCLQVGTIRNRVSQGLDPRPYRVSGRLLFDRIEVDAWIKRQRVPGRRDAAKGGAK